MKFTRRSISILNLCALFTPLVLVGCSDGGAAGDASADSGDTSVLGESAASDVSQRQTGGEEGDPARGDAESSADAINSTVAWFVEDLDEEAFAADALSGIVVPTAYDAELDAYQLDLLALAAESVGTIPHAKARAEAAEKVAVAALRLDAPSIAFEQACRVENWRRGSLVADLAMHFADRGEMEFAEALADRAFRIARGTEADDPQSWRRARIASKAGYVYVLCGRGADAASLLQGIKSPDMGIVDNARARTMSDSDFDAYLESVELAAQAGDLELVVHTFNSCVDLMERFWSDGTRRERLETVVRSHWTSMPIPERLKLTMRLAEVAMEKDSPEAALEYLDEAQDVVDGSQWLPRHLLPVQAELAVMRFEAGDETGGRAQLRHALATYDTEWVDMTDIWRAGALRPVAEGFHSVGRVEDASMVYARVLEDGNTNPNVKPRAEDLSATCCSMALHGFAPSDAMWKRMRELRVGLVQPD